MSKRPQCTKDYVKSVDQQITTLDKFRSAGPEAVGQLCSLIELGSDWLGGELPDSTRKQLKDMLGVDVDLRYIKTQCRVGQGNLDRELMTRLGLSQIRAGALQRHDLAWQGLLEPSTALREDVSTAHGYPPILMRRRHLRASVRTSC